MKLDKILRVKIKRKILLNHHPIHAVVSFYHEYKNEKSVPCVYLNTRLIVFLGQPSSCIIAWSKTPVNRLE